MFSLHTWVGRKKAGYKIARADGLLKNKIKHRDMISKGEKKQTYILSSNFPQIIRVVLISLL